MPCKLCHQLTDYLNDINLITDNFTFIKIALRITFTLIFYNLHKNVHRSVVIHPPDTSLVSKENPPAFYENLTSR